MYHLLYHTDGGMIQDIRGWYKTGEGRISYKYRSYGAIWGVMMGKVVVELRGFEPLTSSVQRRRSPGLSYSPTFRGKGVKV